VASWHVLQVCERGQIETWRFFSLFLSFFVCRFQVLMLVKVDWLRKAPLNLGLGSVFWSVVVNL